MSTVGKKLLQYKLQYKHFVNQNYFSAQNITIKAIKCSKRRLDIEFKNLKCPYSEFFWSVFSPNVRKYEP